MDARLTFMIVAVLSPACAPTGDNRSSCSEEPAPEPPCCSSSIYERITVADFTRDPGRYVGARLELVGLGDWYRDERTGADCTCAGGACSCLTPMGLRSEECGSMVALTGEYSGLPVQCGPDGCWPLTTLLTRYAVCGLVIPGDPAVFGARPPIDVDAFCAY